MCFSHLLQMRWGGDKYRWNSYTVCFIAHRLCQKLTRFFGFIDSILKYWQLQAWWIRGRAPDTSSIFPDVDGLKTLVYKAFGHSCHPFRQMRSRPLEAHIMSLRLPIIRSRDTARSALFVYPIYLWCVPTQQLCEVCLWWAMSADIISHVAPWLKTGLP